MKTYVRAYIGPCNKRDNIWNACTNARYGIHLVEFVVNNPVGNTNVRFYAATRRFSIAVGPNSRLVLLPRYFSLLFPSFFSPFIHPFVRSFVCLFVSFFPSFFAGKRDYFRVCARFDTFDPTGHRVSNCLEICGYSVSSFCKTRRWEEKTLARTMDTAIYV